MLTAEQYVENQLAGSAGTALQVVEAQNACEAFVDGFRDLNKAGGPVDWSVVDYHGIPREFIERCIAVYEYEVKFDPDT